MYEKQTELGGFNNKKITKKIAATWKQEKEDVKSVYSKRCDEQKLKHEKIIDAYEEEIDIWKKNKQSKEKRSDGMPDCNCQYCIDEIVEEPKKEKVEKPKGEKPFACDICLKRFNTEWYVEVHKEKQHSS